MTRDNDNEEGRRTDGLDTAASNESAGVRNHASKDDAAHVDHTEPSSLQPLIDAGYELIPLPPRSKAPRIEGWRTRAFASERILAHVAKGGNAGVRLRETDLVIDVDPRNGGLESLARLEAELGLDLRDAPTVLTGSGGLHIYFRLPPGASIRETVDAMPGVELKTLGRQVVAPGSVHPNGRRYEWDPLMDDPAAAPIAPEVLLARYARAHRPDAAGLAEPAAGWDHPSDVAWARDFLSRAAEPAIEGQRGDARTYETACALRDRGIAEETAFDLMGELYNGRCDPPWPDDELRAKVANAYRYATGEPGGDSAASDFEDGPDAAAVPSVKPVADQEISINKAGRANDDARNALVAVRKAGLDPTWDELKEKVVFMAADLPWSEDYGRELNDHTLRMVRLLLMQRHQGVRYQPSKDNVLEALMTLAYGAKVNPVTEYLDGLEWDGVGRVERLFADYFNCGDGDYERAVSRCFMVGAVRRMRHPGSKFDTMPVLRSAQGWDKSSGLRALFGPDWFSDAQLGGLRDKDALLLLRGIWVHEFAELEALSRAEVTTMKAFVVRQIDRVRDPYDRMVRDVPRRCVFVGTTNEGGYLRDSTGNRRFWPLTVRQRVDVAAILRDRDQLWAEAAMLEAKGVSDVLPTELWPTAAERQEDEATEDPWADDLREFLERRSLAHALGDDDRPPDKVHTVELFDALGLDRSRQTSGLSSRLRTVMEERIGWRHKRSIRIGGRVGAGFEAV